jgi:hypothetical protein
MTLFEISVRSIDRLTCHDGIKQLQCVIQYNVSSNRMYTFQQNI